jgi:hypothetical protein
MTRFLTVDLDARAITGLQAFEFLDGEYAGFADAIAGGGAAFWLGSGISISRFLICSPNGISGLCGVDHIVLCLFGARLDKRVGSVLTDNAASQRSCWRKCR